MAEQRERKPRVRKRLSMLFGTSLPLTTRGFTVNLSSGGVAIQSTVVHPPGTRLHLEFNLPDGSAVQVIARVVWTVRPYATLGISGSMGMEVEQPSEAFKQLANQPITGSWQAVTPSQARPPSQTGTLAVALKPVVPPPTHPALASAARPATVPTPVSVLASATTKGSPPATAPEDAIERLGPRERRKRFAVDYTVEVQAGGAPPFKAQMINVSREGLALATPTLLAPGTVVKVSFGANGKRIDLM